MLKQVPQTHVWAFDAEWIPDPDTGRRVYASHLAPDATDEEVLRVMYEKGGATPENPQPFLKMVLCRVVSIAVLMRTRHADRRISHRLYSLPQPEDPISEGELLQRFLDALHQKNPQLVGFNSHSADIIIMAQRALVHHVHLPALVHRPAKPWDPGADYFGKGNLYHVDLKDEFSGWGKGTPSLHELACALRIPGKIAGMDGYQVAEYWREGRIAEIVQYNEWDAITTFLVWLRGALFAGHINPEEFIQEQEALRQYLEMEANKGSEHLRTYLNAWMALQQGP